MNQYFGIHPDEDLYIQEVRGAGRGAWRGPELGSQDIRHPPSWDATWEVTEYTVSAQAAV